MLTAIRDLNQWYDNLREPWRLLICLGLVGVALLSRIWSIYPFMAFAIVTCAVRMPSICRHQDRS